MTKKSILNIGTSASESADVEVKNPHPVHGYAECDIWYIPKKNQYENLSAYTLQFLLSGETIK